MPTSTQVTAPTHTAADYRLASAVAKHVSLTNVTMTSISAKLQKPFKHVLEAMLKGDVPAAIGWRAAHKLSEAATDLSVIVDFRVDFGKEEQRENSDVCVICTYTLDYTLDSPPPDDSRDQLLAAFAKVNGVYNAWPYLREIVQNTVSRMGLPPPVIPVFRPFRPSDKTEKKAEGGATDDRAAETNALGRPATTEAK
jgi:hypothetical protein